MLRLYHLFLGALVIAVLTPLGLMQAFSKLSLNHKSQRPPTVQTSAPQKQGQTTATNSQPAQVNIWKSILGKTAAPSGWAVAACEGSAPLLCVTSQGKLLGTVEMGIYPLEKQPNFQNMLAQSGIPTGSNIDYQSPKYQTQVASALKLWIADHYSVLAKDRQGEYSDKVTFSSQPPHKLEVGKLQGMRYGFAGLKKQGGVHEEHRGYVAFDGKALYVIKTAFDTASETGRFEKLENFQSFEPHLSAIVKDVKLP
ncbi:hypothetical protein NUACC21_44400 [Scytonema sp. NUACC21]